MGQIMEILRHRRKNFTVLSGDDALTLPMIALGADGAISVVANETPRLFSSMVRLCLEGNFSEARTIHEELLQLMNLNFINPTRSRQGCPCNHGNDRRSDRLPLTPMSSEHRFAVRRALEELHLMETQR